MQQPQPGRAASGLPLAGEAARDGEQGMGSGHLGPAVSALPTREATAASRPGPQDGPLRPPVQTALDLRAPERAAAPEEAPAAPAPALAPDGISGDWS